jgi:GNAT superfamily N-acetyltransferase
MQDTVVIRKAADIDRPFILGLSPELAEVAGLSWHSDTRVQQFQDDYITKMLDQEEGPQTTLIAEMDGSAMGFVHVRETNDSISEEICATVPLLAVAPDAQGRGIGRVLMKAAEDWSKEQGYRLLHLEVFANNGKAQTFYQSQGFQPETLVMIKPLQ